MFSLIAGKTCPMAGKCKKYCYGKKGTYLYPSVIARREACYQASLKDNFVDYMTANVNMVKAEVGNADLYIRIHDTGDFYSIEYVKKWFEIARNCPDVKFYTYTKSVTYVKSAGEIPENLTITYSLGGLEDLEIPEGSKVAMVYDGQLPEGWIRGNDDDLTMYRTDKIALELH